MFKTNLGLYGIFNSSTFKKVLKPIQRLIEFQIGRTFSMVMLATIGLKSVIGKLFSSIRIVYTLCKLVASFESKEE